MGNAFFSGDVGYVIGAFQYYDNLCDYSLGLRPGGTDSVFYERCEGSIGQEGDGLYAKTEGYWIVVEISKG